VRRLRDNEERTPYASALDLPSVRDLLKQIEGMKALTLFIGRKHRAEVIRVEKDVRELAAQVDAFYALLGDRHWIFHERLNTNVVERLLKLDADAAEAALIDHYCDEDALSFMLMQLKGLADMQPRMALVEHARDDYLEGRYYAVVLVLLAVMDGFVNDIDASQRRGLHARDPSEMAAWDSVVGHHLGLSHAHGVFTRSTFKTSEEPLFELQRNGIIHGTLVNYDNVIVATKAWNRLFAVADWARSLEKEKVEPEPPPTWRGIFSQMAKNAEAQRALDEWRPFTLTADDPAFAENEVVQSARTYLEAWKAKNYGAMATLITPMLGAETPSKRAGVVREECSEFELVDHVITQADFRSGRGMRIAHRGQVHRQRVSCTYALDSRSGRRIAGHAERDGHVAVVGLGAVGDAQPRRRALARGSDARIVGDGLVLIVW
jgi:hypothetical protein